MQKLTTLFNIFLQLNFHHLIHHQRLRQRMRNKQHRTIAKNDVVNSAQSGSINTSNNFSKGVSSDNRTTVPSARKLISKIQIRFFGLTKF